MNTLYINGHLCSNEWLDRDRIALLDPELFYELDYNKELLSALFCLIQAQPDDVVSVYDKDIRRNLAICSGEPPKEWLNQPNCIYGSFITKNGKQCNIRFNRELTVNGAAYTGLRMDMELVPSCEPLPDYVEPKGLRYDDGHWNNSWYFPSASKQTLKGAFSLKVTEHWPKVKNGTLLDGYVINIPNVATFEISKEDKTAFTDEDFHDLLTRAFEDGEIDLTKFNFESSYMMRGEFIRHMQKKSSAIITAHNGTCPEGEAIYAKFLKHFEEEEYNTVTTLLVSGEMGEQDTLTAID